MTSVSPSHRGIRRRVIQGATRIVDFVVERAVKLPAPETGYTVDTLRVPMRDGVTLLTDHYSPATPSPRGTLLIRSPYGRGRLSLWYSRPFARRGYHVLLQSVRGTFGSEGVFNPFNYDTDDAADTIKWLRTQSWFDGRLATIGLSYLGFAQWALMTDPPPELGAAVVVVGPHDFHRWTWPGGGAFNLNDCLAWSNIMVHQEESALTLAATVLKTPRRMAKAFNALPAGKAATDLLGGDAAPWLHEWLGHPNRNDECWRRITHIEAALDRAQSPVMLIGGWQDFFLDQTLEQYRRLRTRDIDVRLAVGPWTHTQMIGRTAAGLQLRDALAWFAEHLGGDSQPTRSARVRVFVTGSGWRELDDWPPQAVQKVLYPQARGALADQPANAATTVQFVYDPADPTPSIGGPMLSRAGGRRNDTRLSTRSDVLCFDSTPLDIDLQVIGCPLVELSHTTDIPHADVFVRLSEVGRGGRSRNVGEGFVRLDPDNRSDVVGVQLDGIAHRFKVGSRIRLLIAGGSHPRFMRNLGTGEPLATATTLRPCIHTIALGANTRLSLPTVDNRQ